MEDIELLLAQAEAEENQAVALASDENWKKITKYSEYTEYVSDYLPVEVINREIGDVKQEVSVSGESSSQYIEFEMDRFQDGIDLVEKLINVHYEIEEGIGSNDSVVNAYYTDTKIKFGWIIPFDAVSRPGTIKFCIFAVGDVEDKEYIYITKPKNYVVNEGLYLSSGMIEPDHDWYIQFVKQLENMNKELLIQSREELQEEVKDAEAWAKGTKGGEPVPSTDPTYQHNAKYYYEEMLKHGVVNVRGDWEEKDPESQSFILNKPEIKDLSSKASGNPLKLSSTDAPLIDFVVRGFTHVSSNRWDEEWEVGSYSTGDGSKVARNDAIRSANLIPVKPSTNYFFFANGKSASSGVIVWFDSNKNFITFSVGKVNNYAESPNNASYLGFYITPNNTYNHDIAIIEGTSGEYEPYGMTSLGDQWGVVDLGDCDWSSVFSAQDGRFITSNLSQNIKPISDESISPSFHCESYDNFAYENRNSYTIGISQDTQGRVIVKDPDFISKDASYVKNKLKGKLLFYELADNATPSMYAVRVDEVGKNLWDDSKANHYYYDYTNGNRAVYDSYLSMGYDLIPLKLGESITISYKSNLNIWGAFVVFNKDGIYKGQVSGFMDNEKKMTYTADDDVLVSTQLYRNPTITIGVDLFDIQLEKNTTSTDYVPFAGSQTVFIPTSQPLQEGDSISYHVDGSGVEHREMNIFSDVSTLNWSSFQQDGKTVFYAVMPSDAKLSTNNINDTSIAIKSFLELYDCKSIKEVYGTDVDTSYAIHCVNGTDPSHNYIYLRDYSCADVVALKAKLSGKPLVYEVERKTDTPLSADQVAELKKLKSYNAETNISTDTLASMDVTHYANNDNAEVVGDLQSQILDRDFVATETKMLGWNVPSACPIKNEVNGNTFIQKVGRIQFGDLTWAYSGTNIFFASSDVPSFAKNENYYCYGYKNVGLKYDGAMKDIENMSIGYANAQIKIKNTSYTDANTFKTAMSGVYIYYELATPITMQIDGNEAVERVKAELVNRTPQIKIIDNTKSLNDHITSIFSGKYDNNCTFDVFLETSEGYYGGYITKVNPTYGSGIVTSHLGSKAYKVVKNSLGVTLTEF